MCVDQWKQKKRTKMTKKWIARPNCWKKIQKSWTYFSFEISFALSILVSWYFHVTLQRSQKMHKLTMCLFLSLSNDHWKIKPGRKKRPALETHGIHIELDKCSGYNNFCTKFSIHSGHSICWMSCTNFYLFASCRPIQNFICCTCNNMADSYHPDFNTGSYFCVAYPSCVPSESIPEEFAKESNTK